MVVIRFIKKIVAWTAAIAASFFVLVLLALLLLPQLVNLEAVKQGILETVSSETGGQLTYSRVEILYLPRPSVTLQQATLSISDEFTCSLRALRVYPEIVGLLKGQIRLAALQIEHPRFTFRPSADNDKPDQKPVSITAETVQTVAASLLAIPAFQTPGFRIRIINGHFSLPSAAGPEISFQSIHARAHRTVEKLRIKLSGTSSLGRRIGMSAQVTPDSLTGNADIQVRGFRPHLLLSPHHPPPFFPLVDSRLDLNLKLQFEATRRLRIEVQAANPVLRFRRLAEETVLKSKTVKAVVNIRKNTTVVSVSDLRLEQPGLQVSGSLLINRSDPEIRLNLTAGGIDVTALRQAALTILGRVKTVRDISTVITGGHVPIITVHARGQSPADLSRFENYIIRGNISGGDLFIPGVTLEISGVKGEASIADGVLKGTNISAQMGNSSGKNGQLTLGLVGRNAPFHLDIETLADVAQVQSVLLQLVDSENFNRELKKVVYLSGTAEGRLVIGEQLNDLQVTVAVNSAQVFAEYTRIPYPVVLSGGRYLFHSTRCVVDQVNARVGDSELRDLSLGLDWSQNGHLKVSGGSSQIKVRELIGWLETIDSVQPELQSLQFLDGTIALTDFSINGPLHEMQQWQYGFNGKVEQLGFRPAILSEAVWVDTMQFAAEPAGATDIRFQATDSHIRWGASRMQLSGVARISANGADLDADLSIDEITGTQISQLAGAENSDAGTEQSRDFWPRWLEGVVRVNSDRFKLGNLTFTSVEAGIILHPDNMAVKTTRTDLCGISVPSLLTISPWKLTFRAEPETAGTALDSLFTCLLKEPGVVTGQYEMAGSVTADTLNDDFYRSLDGHIQFASQSGRIYRHGVLSKILALLNVTEIFRGRLPDVVKKGFGYKTIKITGEFEDGLFVLREGVIDGLSMTIAFDGHYDLVQQTLDMVVLVAPFKTFDAIIQSLPVVNEVFGGRLMSIPFRVEGKWDESLVRPVAVEEIDSDLLRVLNESLNAETKPAQPLWPDRRTDRHHDHK